MFNKLHLKSIMKKNFEHQSVLVIIKGNIETSFTISDASLIINNKKVILSDEENSEVIIDLMYVRKITIDKSGLKINFIFDNTEIELQT